MSTGSTFVAVGTIASATIGDAAAAKAFQLSLANCPIADGLEVTELKPEVKALVKEGVAPLA